MSSVKPHLPTAPAKAGATQLRDVCGFRALGPTYGGIQIESNLLVGYLGDDLHNRRDISEAGDVAPAGEQIRRHRKIPELRQTAADILDVFVDAEDLMNDDYGGERTTRRWHRTVSGNLAAFNWNRNFAGHEAVSIRSHSLG